MNFFFVSEENVSEKKLLLIEVFLERFMFANFRNANRFEAVIVLREDFFRYTKINVILGLHCVEIETVSEAFCIIILYKHVFYLKFYRMLLNVKKWKSVAGIQYEMRDYENSDYYSIHITVT